MGGHGVGLMEGHLRTIKVALEQRIGQPIPPDHNLFTWMVAFAAATYRRCHIGAEGRTPQERLRRAEGLHSQSLTSVSESGGNLCVPMADQLPLRSDSMMAFLVGM